MEYKRHNDPENSSDRKEANKAIEILLAGIKAELYIRNQIEWLKAMIQYSDEPEKYKKRLEGLMKNDFRTR